MHRARSGVFNRGRGVTYGGDAENARKENAGLENARKAIGKVWNTNTASFLTYLVTRVYFHSSDQPTRTVSLYLAVDSAVSTYGCRAFDYVGPTVWNSLPDELRNSDSFDNFKRFMKTILFSRY